MVRQGAVLNIGTISHIESQGSGFSGQGTGVRPSAKHRVDFSRGEKESKGRKAEWRVQGYWG